MLLRPFGARNGCCGMGKVVRARGVATRPRKWGTLASSWASCGIGEGETPPRGADVASRATTTEPRTTQPRTIPTTADPVPDGERADQDAAPAGPPSQPDQEQRERHRDEEVVERRLVHALAGLDRTVRVAERGLRSGDRLRGLALQADRAHAWLAGA